MIVGSGALTHNLAAYRGQRVDAPAATWVRDFAAWMGDTLSGPRRIDAVDYRSKAPYAVENHPEDEHLLPLFVALGATYDDEPIVRLHDSVEHAVLAMDVYRFG